MSELPILATNEILVEYSQFKLLFQPLRFTNYDGVAFVGPSGSGKTTLLEILAGLEETSTSASSFFYGTQVAKFKRADRHKIAFVSQDPFLVDSVTALENVLHGSLGRYLLPRIGVKSYHSDDVIRAKSILNKLGVDNVSQRALEYSGGERKRIAIARAIMQSPEILILDEPLSSLDPNVSEQVLNYIFSEKRLVIASLHQPEIATKYFKRIIGIQAGELMFDKASLDIKARDFEKLYKSATFEVP